MTTPPAVYGKFGITLAFAEQALTERLHEHLARGGTEPETWYALQLVATRGPGLSGEALTDALERSPNVKADVRELLTRLKEQGVIRGETEVDLTEQGRALHASLREYVVGPTTRLLSQFDIQEIETTVRTLQEITRRAAEE